MSQKIVIIGLGGAASNVARPAKRVDPSLDITILKEEDLLVRCALPYVATGDATLEDSIKSDEMFHSLGIKTVDAVATNIDRENKTVTDANGNVYPYDKLVLNLGGVATVPPIPGRDLKGVFVLHTRQDALNVRDWIKERVAEIVVVGAGAIGLEIAYLVSEKGIKVTVAEMLEHVLPFALDPDMSEEVEKYLAEKEVDLKLKQATTKIIGEGEVTGVELSSGEKIDADMVVLAVGVHPRWELAEAAGLETGEFGLKVNKYLQTSDPDIYAGGDLVEYDSFITGKPIAGQLRPNIVAQGRVIAKNILGYQVEYPKLLNSFATKLFDMSVGSTGITESAAKEEGIGVVTVKIESESKHGMIKGKKPYTVKLIFDKNTKRVIGGQIISLSEGAVKAVDVINLAIRCELTALDLTSLRCSAQPELSPDAGAEPIARAAESVFRKLYPLPSSR